MHIVILGAGALGTVLSAHFARAGEDVTLLARGQRAAYLQEHGATLTGLVDFTVPVRVVTDPSQLHDADVLMVTVKTYDMDAALDGVTHLDVGSVLSIQNGVLKNAQLAQTFGWEKVLGATGIVSAEVLPTGTVRFTANQGFYLGEWPTGTSGRVQTLADTVERAGIVAQVTPSIQALEWAKYVSWVCLMVPGSPDPFGELQDSPRDLSGVRDGKDTAGDGTDRHDPRNCACRYGVLPHQDTLSARVERPPHALAADG